MDTFKKINMLLEEMEELVENGEFEITDSDCNSLYAEIKEELNMLSSHCDPFLWDHGVSDSEPIQMGKKEIEFKKIERRFNNLCKSIETPEEFIKGIRDMMFPDGENDDF
jgi:hypothetical protein